MTTSSSVDPSELPDQSKPLKVRLVGYPIAYSASPLFHNTCFETDGSKWRYELFSTSKVTQEVLDWLKSDEFGGAAFTMPLKAAIIPHLDAIEPEAQLTGAVNTVVKVRAGSGHKFVGTNTDFIGIHSTLLSAIQTQSPTSSPSQSTFSPDQYSAAIIGGGATTRSATLALWTLGIRTIFLVNRDSSETAGIVKWFEENGLVSQGLRLIPLGSIEEVEKYVGSSSGGVPPLAIGVGAIPSILPETPEERRVYSTATHLLGSTSSSLLARHNSASTSTTIVKGSSLIVSRPIFLDMAYHPLETHLLRLAGALGWEMISGDMAMIMQGYAQQRMWRLGDASFATGTGARAGVDVPTEKAEKQARRVVQELGDAGVHVEGVEVDRATL